MKHTRAWTLLLLTLVPGLSLPGSVQADSRIFIAGGGEGEDYATSVFRRLGEVWEPPLGLYGDYSTQIELAIDSSGMLQDCRIKRGSGHDTFDTSACGAAYKAGRFAPPPDGQPTRLLCTLQSQRSPETPEDPDEVLKQQVRERVQRDREYRVREAGYAEEDARARAEAVARERGETFGGYEFIPGQHIPGAKELQERTPIKALPEPRAKGAGEEAAQAKPAEPVVPGPVISRYPPKPELTDLVIETGKGDGKGVRVRTKDAAPDVEAAPETMPVQPAQPAQSSGAKTRAADAADRPDQDAGRAVPAGQDAPAQPQAEEAAEKAQPKAADTASARPATTSGWVLPQPPLPPKGVKGRVIDPSPRTEAARPAAMPSAEQQRTAGSKTAPARPAAAKVAAQPGAPGQKAEPAKPARAESAKAAPAKAEPARPAAQIPAAQKTRPQQTAGHTAAAAPAGSGKSADKTAAQPQVSPSDKPAPQPDPQPAARSSARKPAADWQLPQPPLPPRGVQGKVIDPAAEATPFPLTPERKAEIAAENAARKAARAARKAEEAMAGKADAAMAGKADAAMAGEAEAAAKAPVPAH